MVALAFQQIQIVAPGTFPVTATQTFVGVTAAVGDNTAPADDRGFLEFENTGTAKTITIATPATAGLDAQGVPYPDMTFTLAATTGRMRIPLDPKFVTPSDGLIHFTVGADNTGVTVAALRR